MRDWRQWPYSSAVAVLVPDHPVVHRSPAIDEIPQGDAAVHVGGGHQTDVLREAGEISVPPFSLQEPAENEADEVLRELPHLQEDGGQDREGAPHITRTR